MVLQKCLMSLHRFLNSTSTQTNHLSMRLDVRKGRCAYYTNSDAGAGVLVKEVTQGEEKKNGLVVTLLILDQPNI